MFTLLQAFCVATCILTGAYYLILFRFYKGLQRTLWFPVLCFCLAFSVEGGLCHTPMAYLNADIFPIGFYDNSHLILLNASSLVMSLYNGSAISDEKPRFYHVYNYMAGVFALISIVVPPKLSPAAFIASSIMCAIAYMYGLYVSYKMYVTQSKTYIFSLVSYVLLLVSYIPTSIFLILKLDYVSVRALMIPIYVLIHIYMLTVRYRESIYRTKKMADSLAQTIETIGHSDNALQCTQLKSDFLYDSLDLISERCDSDPFIAEELTISLSKFLRHTLNFQQLKGIVPLSNELELTRAFVSIEKEMHPNLNFVYKLPDILPDVSVPPLSIQPLVENAIEHGLDLDKKEGKVTLTIMPFKDYCQIDVSDNGAGIPQETLEGLPDNFPQTTRIGLYNIEKRLRARFGKGLVIQSAQGVGTSVSFVVPPSTSASEKEVEA